MAIVNVTTANTFNEWRIKNNEIGTAVGELTKLTDTNVRFDGTCNIGGGNYTNEEDCNFAGTCSIGAHTDKVACENSGGTWSQGGTAGVWTVASGDDNIISALTAHEIAIKEAEDHIDLFPSTFVNVIGDSMTGDLNFGDSDKVRFGADADLQVFHDDTDGFIKNSKGTTHIQADLVKILGAAGTENLAKFIKDGSVELYHNNVKQLETTSVGVLVGATASPNSTNSGVQLANNGDGNNSCRSSSGSVTAFRHHFVFYNGNGGVGSISTNGSATAFNTSSDYRLKENVDYTWDATTRLKQLKPARFNFIADDTNTLVDGFIAHEVSSVVPEAISGEKDAVKMQGIDQSKLVPLLVKTIQELEARITALEA